MEPDPRRLGARALQVASIRDAAGLEHVVRLEAVPPIDRIGWGSVAVSGPGAPAGKGGGFSDLEYGLLTETAKVGLRTPIVQMIPRG